MDYLIKKLGKGSRRREYEDIAVFNYQKKVGLLGTITKENIKSIVPLPCGVEFREWLATNTLAFYNHLKLVHDSINDHCNHLSCDALINNTTSLLPNLSSSNSNNNKKINKMTDYIDLALLEIQNHVTDESFLPTRYDSCFPKHFCITDLFRGAAAPARPAPPHPHPRN